MRLTATLCWIACLGCDQFATIGVRDPESANAGAPSPRDAAIPNDAGGASDAGTTHDAGATHDAGTTSDAGAQCERLEVAVCNPVTNEGCPASLMMQCAVDVTAPLTGYCIFFSGPPPALGDTCLNTGITESCPAKSTCVAEQCRKLCFCDADCGAGQCCTEPLASTGFKVCGDC